MRTYEEMLRIINREANSILGEGLDLVISKQLQGNGFNQRGEDGRLEYCGEKLRIFYDSIAMEPFSVDFYANDVEARSEAERSLQGIWESMVMSI